MQGLNHVVRNHRNHFYAMLLRIQSDWISCFSNRPSLCFSDAYSHGVVVRRAERAHNSLCSWPHTSCAHVLIHRCSMCESLDRPKLIRATWTVHIQKSQFFSARAFCAREASVDFLGGISAPKRPFLSCWFLGLLSSVCNGRSGVLNMSTNFLQSFELGSAKSINFSWMSTYQIPLVSLHLSHSLSTPHP